MSELPQYPSLFLSPSLRDLPGVTLCCQETPSQAREADFQIECKRETIVEAQSSQWQLMKWFSRVR